MVSDNNNKKEEEEEYCMASSEKKNRKLVSFENKTNKQTKNEQAYFIFPSRKTREN